MEEALACTNYLFVTGEAKRFVLKTQQLTDYSRRKVRGEGKMFVL